jgi:hypothetical protein
MCGRRSPKVHSRSRDPRPRGVSEGLTVSRESSNGQSATTLQDAVWISIEAPPPMRHLRYPENNIYRYRTGPFPSGADSPRPHQCQQPCHTSAAGLSTKYVVRICTQCSPDCFRQDVVPPAVKHGCPATMDGSNRPGILLRDWEGALTLFPASHRCAPAVRWRRSR